MEALPHVCLARPFLMNCHSFPERSALSLCYRVGGGSSTRSCAFGHSETQEPLGFIFLKTVQSFLDLICRESPGLRERKER